MNAGASRDAARAPRCAILMYHRVAEAPAGSEEGDYALPTTLFEAQLRWLAGSGRPVVPLAALLGSHRPDDSVVLTFDDGCDTDATVAAPLLSELGLPAAFFVTPARLGEPGYLSWDQLRGLARDGFEVGSHGLDHTLFEELRERELRGQLLESKRLLEARLGNRVDKLSLPGGSGGTRSLRAAREAGYRLVLGSRPGVVCGAAPAAVLPRLAIRRRHDLPAFRAAIDQGASLRLRQALRYGATFLARRIVGTHAYRLLRARWLRRAAGDEAGLKS